MLPLLEMICQSESLALALGLLHSAIIKCVTYDELFNPTDPQFSVFASEKKKDIMKEDQTKQTYSAFWAWQLWLSK